MEVRHRKTRKQKIIADYRHQVYSLENKNTLNISAPIMHTNKNPSYTYVLNDVFKTSILTFSIVAGELILFFLLKNHIITLPNVNY